MSPTEMDTSEPVGLDTQYIPNSEDERGYSKKSLAWLKGSQSKITSAHPDFAFNTFLISPTRFPTLTQLSESETEK